MPKVFTDQPFYPLLLAIYPALSLYLTNPGQSTFSVALLGILVSLILVGLFWGIMHLVTRDTGRGALLTAFFVVLFFSYGHVHSTLSLQLIETPFADHPWHLHLVLSLVWLLLFRLGWLLANHIPAAGLSGLTPLFNTATTVFVLLTFAFYPPWSERVIPDPVEIVESQPGDGAIAELGYSPDIYLIVLDGYGRQDILKEYYDFDNTLFLEALEQMDFFVAEDSQANYYWTFLSLLSMLNMEHVTWLRETRGEDSTERGLAYDLTRNNRVARFLSEQGYEIVHFKSTWGSTQFNPYADREIECSSLVLDEEFYRVLWGTTWLRVFDDTATIDLAQCWLSHMESLARMGSEPGPKFVFAHFVPPHHPYLFDRDGNILRHATISNQFEFQENLWEDHAAYIEQIRYLNSAFLEIFHTILEHSEHPPVILLNSDHGPHLKRAGRGRNHEVRMANLMAMHLPGTPEGLISDDITLVNQFPLVLNHYFGTDFEIQPDTLYYSEYHTPYLFQEIKTD